MIFICLFQFFNNGIFSVSFILSGFFTKILSGYVGLAETIFTVTSFLFEALVQFPALSLVFNFTVIPELGTSVAG